MARKREYVVRVVTWNQHTDTLLECLRYAGLIRVHTHRAESTCFDIFAPHGTDTEQWSKMNAERMRTFGYNAVPAPRDVLPE